MPKSRIMGAGLAGATTRDVSVNGCQGGGNKKQGTAFLTGRMDSFAIAEKERQEYEIYEKQFETEESDLQTDELDDYDSDELVDSEDEFRKRR